MEGNLEAAKTTVVKAIALAHDCAMPEMQQSPASMTDEKILAAIALKKETPSLALLNGAFRSLAEVYVMQGYIAKIQDRKDDSLELGKKANQILQYYPDYRWNPYVNFCKHKLKIASQTTKQSAVGFCLLLHSIFLFLEP